MSAGAGVIRRKTGQLQREAKTGSSNGLALRSMRTQFNYRVPSDVREGLNMDHNDSLADKFGAIRGLKCLFM